MAALIVSGQVAQSMVGIVSETVRDAASTDEDVHRSAANKGINNRAGSGTILIFMMASIEVRCDKGKQQQQGDECSAAEEDESGQAARACAGNILRIGACRRPEDQVGGPG